MPIYCRSCNHRVNYWYADASGLFRCSMCGMLDGNPPTVPPVTPRGVETTMSRNRADGVMVSLVATYADALGRHGPDSPQVRTIRDLNAANAEFLDYADALDRVKRSLGGSGMGPGEARP